MKSLIVLLIFISIVISNNTYSQSSSTLVSKRGGIAFRTDDNQQISEYLEYASLFNKYNQKFCFAINLGSTSITSDYIKGVKQLQASGHEMMDHTPQHRTNLFRTILSPDYFINHPGVHRIDGNKIELKHAPVDFAKAIRSGYANINANIITVTDGIFSSFSKFDCYLYFPALNQLVYINGYSGGWIDSNTVKIQDVWTKSTNLGLHQNIKFYNFDINNVHLTVDAIRALTEETIRLAEHYGLQRPYTWIQPGGYSPQVYSSEVKQALSGELGYKAAGTFNGTSLKVFNEYNPDNSRQFGMSWGNFNDDTWDINNCKEVIADRIAKHHILIGHSHFSNLLDGWSGFLNRTEQLIQWCIANNIPIRTYSEWSDILYRQSPDPNENIFPPLNIDLDDNNIPDGHSNQIISSLDKTDGYPTPDEFCYSINKVGKLCWIKDLAGIEKGQNDFEIYTKGAPGNFIEVTFKVGTQNLIYKFPAENSEWTKYNLAQSINGNTSLNIPTNISLIDIAINCSNYSSGEVRISGMKLTKLNEALTVIISNPIISVKIGQLYSYDVNASGNPTSTFSLTTFPIEMTINSTSGLIEWTPATTGDYAVTVKAANGVSPDATQSFAISVQDNQTGGCPSSMISYWKLDETIGSVFADHLGTNNATSTNVPTPVAGRVGGAQQFNGTSTVITAPRIAAYDFATNTSFTYEAWIKHPTSASSEEIIAERKSSGALAINLKVVGLTKATFSVRNNTSQIFTVTGTKSLNDGNWHHIAGVRDGSTNQLRIYVDGVLEGTASAVYTAGFTSADEGISIGWRKSTNNKFFKGTIDEVAIYNSALAPSQIQTHYSNGLQNKGYCAQSQIPITITSPKEGDIWYIGETAIITWTGGNAANNVMIELWKTGGWSEDPSLIILSTPNDGYYEWLVPNEPSWLTPDDDYTLRISGGDTGDESDYFSITTRNSPTNLNATKIDYKSIGLTWRDNSSTETNYNIERRQPPVADWSQIAQVGANVLSYTDNSLDANTFYCYRVRAYNSNGSTYSDYSGAKCASTDLSPIICPPTIISYWKLDETNGTVFDDYVGTNNATSLDPPTPVAGRVGQAQQFNGTSNGITAPRIAQYDFATNASFTYEAVIERTEGSFVSEEVIIERKSSSEPLAINLKFAGSTKAMFSIRNNTSQSYSVTGKTNLYNGIWHHIVGVRDGSTNQLRIYVDGLLEGSVSAPYTAAFSSTTAGISIGWRNSTNNKFFKGIIDEVAIYNSALDAETISQHYNYLCKSKGYCEATLPKISLSSQDIFSSVESNVNGNTVQLNWETPSELGGGKFEIERRASLSDGAKDWQKIGEIDLFNGGESKSFSYNDNPNTTGKFSYKIKFAIDGEEIYSDEIEVEVLPADYALYQNYPNPFNPTTKIVFSLPKQTELRILLYNMLGEAIKTIAEGKYDAGYYEVKLVANDLPSGVYVYRLESKEFLSTKKLLLMK